MINYSSKLKIQKSNGLQLNFIPRILFIYSRIEIDFVSKYAAHVNEHDSKIPSCHYIVNERKTVALVSTRGNSTKQINQPL